MIDLKYLKYYNSIVTNAARLNINTEKLSLTAFMNVWNNTISVFRTITVLVRISGDHRFYHIKPFLGSCIGLFKIQNVLSKILRSFYN